MPEQRKIFRIEETLQGLVDELNAARAVEHEHALRHAVEHGLLLGQELRRRLFLLRLLGHQRALLFLKLSSEREIISAPPEMQRHGGSEDETGQRGPHGRGGRVRNVRREA